MDYDQHSRSFTFELDTSHRVETKLVEIIWNIKFVFESLTVPLYV